MSFLSLEAHSRLVHRSLVHMSRLIDWESLRPLLGNLGRSGFGPRAYDPLKMFKALVLQAWHSLSDVALEEALRVRLDFMVITGLEDVPDSTTICRFRTLLIGHQRLDHLFQAVNQQLEFQGLKVEKTKGAIIDATLISSACRPSKEMEAMACDREEEDSCQSFDLLAEESLSKDPDARWLKKGRRSYFGYKGFMITDSGDGFITHVHVTPAHQSEVKELANILDRAKVEGRLYGDKGYASQENKTLVRSHGLKNGLMEKAKRNKPLSPWQKRFNRLISKVRYKVEQGFGTLKRRFSFARASYRGLEKVQGQMILKSLAFNLLKALNIAKKRILMPHLCLN